MIELSYQLTSRSDLIGWEHSRDCGTATRSELLWHFFPGDIGIRTDLAEWWSEYGWIPLLHAGLSFMRICDKLEVSSDAVYYFTEADEVIEFHRCGESVTIVPPNATITLTCAYRELRDAVGKFARRLVVDISATYPSLCNTEVAADLLDWSGDLT